MGAPGDKRYSRALTYGTQRDQGAPKAKHSKTPSPPHRARQRKSSSFLSAKFGKSLIRLFSHDSRHRGTRAGRKTAKKSTSADDDQALVFLHLRLFSHTSTCAGTSQDRYQAPSSIRCTSQRTTPQNKEGTTPACPISYPANVAYVPSLINEGRASSDSCPAPGNPSPTSCNS